MIYLSSLKARFPGDFIYDAISGIFCFRENKLGSIKVLFKQTCHVTERAEP